MRYHIKLADYASAQQSRFHWSNSDHPLEVYIYRNMPEENWALAFHHLGKEYWTFQNGFYTILELNQGEARNRAIAFIRSLENPSRGATL